MRRLIAAFGTCLILAGCSPRVTRVTLPSGDPGYSIACNSSDPLDECTIAAGIACPFGYQPITSEDKNGFAVGSFRSGRVIAGSTWEKSLTVKCFNDTLVQAILQRADSLKKNVGEPPPKTATP